MGKIVFLDLDDTIIRSEKNLVVINKNKPKDIIYNIPASESYFLNGYYKKDNIPVIYNGNSFHISKELFNKIKNIDRTITPESIGIVNRELNSKQLIDQSIHRTEFIIDNLTTLKNNSNYDLCILSARSNLKEHKDFLEFIKNKIKAELNKSIKRIYFISDFDADWRDDAIAYKKTKILCEHLIGYKIKNGIFTNIPQNEYDIVELYDDSDINIQTALQINEFIDVCINRSKDETIVNEIKSKIENGDKLLITHKVTGNKLNPTIIKNTNIEIRL